MPAVSLVLDSNGAKHAFAVDVLDELSKVDITLPTSIFGCPHALFFSSKWEHVRDFYGTASVHLEFKQDVGPAVECGYGSRVEQ